jgi:exonuclease SbcC
VQGRIARLESELAKCDVCRQQQIEAQRLHDDVALRLLKKRLRTGGARGN